MKSYLVTYLWVTGVGSAIVIAAPVLVVLFSFALILPGLILALLPTAFLYGVFFALVWFPLHRLIGDWPAAVIGALVSVVAMYALPIPGNRVTEARYKAELKDDMLPAKPIALAGHLRIDSVKVTDRKSLEKRIARRSKQLEPWQIETLDKQCNDLCMALLFQDGVKSVTVNGHAVGDTLGLEPNAATFALIKRDGRGCANLVAEAPFSMLQVSTDALREYWNLRLTSDLCLVRIPTRSTHDIRIVISDLLTPLPEKMGSSRYNTLWPRPVSVDRLEILDATGRLLLRQSWAQAIRVNQPLFYGPSGGIENTRFAWKTSEFEPLRQEDSEFAHVLERHAGLKRSVDSVAVAQGIREQLAALLNDPARAIDKPAADLVPAFFKSMHGREVTEPEFSIAFRLIGDKRFSDYNSLPQLTAALGPDAGRLRVPIVSRLLAADPIADGPLFNLGKELEKLPPHTFATLTSDDAALLADPLRRTLAPGLIKRQADRGSVSATLLVGILVEQVRLEKAPRGNGRIEHSEAIKAAIDGLTRLGPAASGQLGRLETLAAQGLAGRWSETDDWRLMLARLGKPVDDNELRWDLKRYDRDIEEQAKKWAEQQERRNR